LQSAQCSERNGSRAQPRFDDPLPDASAQFLDVGTDQALAQHDLAPCCFGQLALSHEPLGALGEVTQDRERLRRSLISRSSRHRRSSLRSSRKGGNDGTPSSAGWRSRTRLPFVGSFGALIMFCPFSTAHRFVQHTNRRITNQYVLGGIATRVPCCI